MKTSVLVTVLAILGCSLAQAQSKPFDLREVGNQVCKVGKHFPKPDCFEKPMVNEKLIPGDVDLVPRAKALLSQDMQARLASGSASVQDIQKVGGAMFLNQNDVKTLAENFQEFAIRNVGVRMGAKQGDPIAFVASIKWKGVIGLNGTVHIEGNLNLNNASFTGSEKEMVAQLVERFDIGSFHDSSTEQQMESLRFLEHAARVVQIKSIYGVSANVDKETLRLIKNVAAPAVFAEVIYIPMSLSLAESLGEAIVKGIGDAIVKGLGDAVKTPVQP